VARELINDHNPYYQNVALQTPESGDAFQQFLFGVVFDGALQRTAADRKQHLASLAESLNDGGADFAALVARGSGVTGLRLPLLAMTLPSMLDFTELPEAEDQRMLADEQTPPDQWRRWTKINASTFLTSRDFRKVISRSAPAFSRRCATATSRERISTMC
jgi:hypothetical protein